MKRLFRAWGLALFLISVGVSAQTPPIAISASETDETTASKSTTDIPLESDDQQIRARITQTFAQIESLRGVDVQVRAGVVLLSGTTLDVEARAQAKDIASRVDGVASVENRLQVEARIDRRVEPLVRKANELGQSIVAFLPLLAIALVVLAAFWFAGALLTRKTNIFSRVAPNPFIQALLEQILRMIFNMLGLVVAMSVIGASALLGTILGAAGVLGLAVGFAVRDTIENYIASVLLSIRQPFRPNDSVVIEGVEGRVTTLNSRATILTTSDGNEVRIPNATVYKAKKQISRTHRNGVLILKCE